MTKRELIEKLAKFLDDALILRGDADWGSVEVQEVKMISHHRTFKGGTYWTECWDEEHCSCQDEDYGDERQENRLCVRLG